MPVLREGYDSARFERAAQAFSSHCCLHCSVLFQALLRLVYCIACIVSSIVLLFKILSQVFLNLLVVLLNIVSSIVLKYCSIVRLPLLLFHCYFFIALLYFIVSLLLWHCHCDIVVIVIVVIVIVLADLQYCVYCYNIVSRSDDCYGIIRKALLSSLHNLLLTVVF
jgi:hypothetical protein